MLPRYVEDDGSVSAISIEHRPIFIGYYKEDKQWLQTKFYIPYEAAQDIHLCLFKAELIVSEQTVAIIILLHECLKEMTVEDLKQIKANIERPKDKAMMANEVDARWTRRSFYIRQAEVKVTA